MSFARSEPPGARDILCFLDEALTAVGASHGTLAMSCPPHFHARSTIYFVTDADGPDRACRWVVKCPHEGYGQDDLASPLPAEHQYQALKVLTAHFATSAPRLRVPRPVAYLPDAGALVMEYVSGRGLDCLIGPACLLRPQELLNGIALSGRFLRHLHALEPQRSMYLSARILAEEVLELAEERMGPVGLVLPPVVLETLRDVSGREVAVAAVRLHGDFAPVNMLLDGRSSVTGIDVSLAEAGLAEDDLARFLMMLVTERLFLLCAESARARVLRDRAHATLLEAYVGDPQTSLFLELRFIHQLCLRWLWKHNARAARSASLTGLRRRVVDRYFEALLGERAEALATATRAAVRPQSHPAAQPLQAAG